jgi:uncharacterized protein (DUF1778 family)
MNNFSITFLIKSRRIKTMNKELKTEIIKVVLTPSTRDLVEKYAELEGKSLSCWIRELILQKLKEKGE